MSQHNTNEAQLIQDNLGLVVRVVQSLHPPNSTELEEYTQIGKIALLKAIREHNPSRAKLSTFAWNYIRWDIIKYINDSNKHHVVSINTNDSYMKAASLWEFLPESLSDKERKVVELRSMGFTFEEIGHNMGKYSKSWIFCLFQSAKKKILHSNQRNT